MDGTPTLGTACGGNGVRSSGRGEGEATERQAAWSQNGRSKCLGHGTPPVVALPWPMRRKVVIAALVVLAFLAVTIALWPRRSRVELDVAFEIVELGTTQATVAWRTRETERGSLRFEPLLGGRGPEVVTAPPPRTTKHRLMLRGLEPGTRYRYALAAGGPSFTFETEPLPGTPFSFLLVWGPPPPNVVDRARSESAAFILSLAELSREGADPYAAVRPSLRVFGPTGPDSRVAARPRSESWALDWGGLRLLLVGDPEAAASLLERPSAHTIGIILTESEPDLDAAEVEALHATIVQHNTANPGHRVAFVLMQSAERTPDQRDDVNYALLQAPRGDAPEAGLARVDVGPDSTVAQLLGDGEELVLRKPPLRRWRSCKECRALADQGAYEQSVRAYQAFIADHEGHYQIDDAHYAIAQLLDERLFRFAEALEWYRKLVVSYPESTLVPLARQRVGYLSARADGDFQPLARFERIRKVELARHKAEPSERSRLLGEIGALLVEFPNCAIGAEVSYWLANQYRTLDPERAVALYRELLQRHPASAFVSDARIEIGETYYDARRYREAVVAFREAAVAEPERAAAIGAQLARSERNLRRGRLAWASWGLAGLVFALGLVRAPRLPSAVELRRAAVAFVAVALLTLTGAWFIHEQFATRTELFGLALTGPLVGCFAYPLTAKIGRWLTGTTADAPRGRARRAALVGMLLDLVLLLATSYLAIYYLCEHYLTGFGL